MCCVDANCLLIPDFSGRMTALNATSTSLLLKLQLCRPSPNCRGVSMPSVRYVVQYRQTNSSGRLPSVTCQPLDTSTCHTQVTSHLARDSMLSALYAIANPSVCLSHGWISRKRLNVSSKFFHQLIGPTF